MASDEDEGHGPTQSSNTNPTERRIRATYDAIAEPYALALSDELDGKPIDRALLDSFAELAGGGQLLDLGCGPGHVTGYLAERHPDVRGIDLSPEMIRIARERHPRLRFDVGSMLELPIGSDALAGVAALYSVIHLSPVDRATAFAEMARTVRPGGWVTIAFHVDGPDVLAGDRTNVSTWYERDVDADVYYLAPETVTTELAAAGLEVTATTVRQPWPGTEYPSRRCWLLARRPKGG